MNFNKHWELEGQHAFLGASQYHWLRYSPEKLRIAYGKRLAKQRGTEYHELAERLIKLREKLPRSKKTLNQYVNDAIGFKMKTEVLLKYSRNCFCTADAISFKKNFLRIHDLKTGTTKASFDQLLINAAVFCLEYGIHPNDIDIELRIYQLDEVRILVPEKEVVLQVMQIIKDSDDIIEEMREMEEL